MPRRKKDNAISETPKRATRSSTKTTPALNGASSDELPSPMINPLETSQPEEVANEIIAYTTRAKSKSKSDTSSRRPSTATSDAPSQRTRRRVAATPVKKDDVDMYDVNNIDDDDGEDELANEGPALKKPKPIVIKVVASSARKGKSKYDNPIEMLTNPGAPLATAKLRDILCNTKAWDLLNPDEQRHILSLFPDEKEIIVSDVGTGPPRPDVAALRNNDDFRHDAARYQNALSKGWHDPEWIRQARFAHERRGAGDYDAYLAAHFEEDWGIPMPMPTPAPAPAIGHHGGDGDDGGREGASDENVWRGDRKLVRRSGGGDDQAIVGQEGGVNPNVMNDDHDHDVTKEDDNQKNQQEKEENIPQAAPKQQEKSEGKKMGDNTSDPKDGLLNSPLEDIRDACTL